MAREQERIAHVTEYEVAQAMITFGGSFVACLGQAWHAADEANRARLLAAFPDVVREYRDIARRHRERVRRG